MRHRSGSALRASVLFGFALALAIPVYAFFHDRNGTTFLTGVHGKAVLQAFFPLVGLYAFTFVTAQVLIATNLWWLTRLWPGIIRYHRAQGVFALLFAVLHPLFILVGFGLASLLSSSGFVRPGLGGWLIPAYTALAILAFTVVTALLAWSGRRVSWWRSVHRLNYLVFALVWVHSWFIGTDTPTHLLRVVWMTYLVLVIGSTIGRYRSAHHRRAAVIAANA
jgi:DMSO/TMAO reductase YedYZ heme-binding membrane subunit